MIAKKILVTSQIPLRDERVAIGTNYSTDKSDQVLLGLRMRLEFGPRENLYLGNFGSQANAFGDNFVNSI